MSPEVTWENYLETLESEGKVPIDASAEMTFNGEKVVFRALGQTFMKEDDPEDFGDAIIQAFQDRMNESTLEKENCGLYPCGEVPGEGDDEGEDEGEDSDS